MNHADATTVRSEQGSVLLLFPAAFMIVLLLGALAIDAAVVFLGQRDLISAAAAAANDAAMLGIAAPDLRDEGRIRLDPTAVERSVYASLEARGILEDLSEAPSIRIDAEQRIEVSLVAHVDYILAHTLPGVGQGRTIRATVRAEAALDDSNP